jgi:hypothetical protein
VAVFRLASAGPAASAPAAVRKPVERPGAARAKNVVRPDAGAKTRTATAPAADDSSRKTATADEWTSF